MGGTFLIPTTPEAQVFQIALAGVNYEIFLYWNTMGEIWCIDISDTQGNRILSGIPLVANVDLLEQYGYMNFGGKLVAQTDNSIELPPTYSNLGSVGNLYFITP